jgi:PAS domain S-box-containing protein
MKDESLPLLNGDLHHWVTALAGATSLDEAARVISQHARTLAGATAVTIALVTQDQQALHILETPASSGGVMTETRLPIHARPEIVSAIASDEPVIVDEHDASAGQRCLLPLRLEGNVIGALVLDVPSPGDITVARESLVLLASLTALALGRHLPERRAAEEALRKSEARHRFIADLSTLLSQIADPDTLLGRVSPVIAEHFGVDQCACVEVDAAGTQLLVSYTSRSDRTVLREEQDILRLFTGDTLARLSAGEPVFLADLVSPDPKLGDARSPAAGVVMPVHRQGRFAACILLMCHSPRFWTDGEINLLRTVTIRTWLALENSRLLRATQEALAERDAMVGLLTESEERFRQLAENNHSVFWIMELPERRLVYVSPVATVRWGLDPPSSHAESGNWWAPVHPADQEAVQRALETALETGELDIEYRVLGPGRTVRWVRDRAFGVRNSEGQVYRLTGIADEVTEQRRAAAALRESEERLRIALEGAPIIVYQQDRDLRYVWVYNTGLAFRTEDVLGRTDIELLGASDGEPLTAIKRQVLETGSVARAEVCATVAGSTRYFDVTIEPVRSNSGEIEGVTGAAIDITDRKLREERIGRLQHLTASLASAVDAAEVARAIVDFSLAVGASACTVYTFDPAREHLAPLWTRGYLPGANETCVERQVSTGDSPVADAVMRRLPLFFDRRDERLRRYPREEQCRIAGGDGAAMALPLLIEGQPTGALSIVFPDDRTISTEERDFFLALADVCAQALERARLYEAERQARQAAQAAQERYRVLFEGAGDAIVVTDLAGAYLDANPAAQRLLGYPRATLLSLRLIDLVPESETWVTSVWSALIQAGVWEGEHLVRRADGATLPVETRAQVLALPSGRIVQAVIRDISQRRAHEQMQQEFFASVSHDLKNPLAALKGQVQLLQRRARRHQQLSAADLEQPLRAIESIGDRMTAMIEELVDVAQLRSGHPLRLRPEPVDLVSLCKRRVEEHQHATTQHQIHVFCEHEHVIGWWDARRLERVLDNLLTNAVKYSQGGTIAVRLGWEERAGVRWAKLEIEDQGVGIPAADLPFIFERFRRGSNVEDRVAGTGLGLAGAREVVMQHGGEVTIDSEEGRGTCVTIWLPVRAHTAEDADSENGCSAPGLD